jgi:hypothetical protein
VSIDVQVIDQAGEVASMAIKHLCPDHEDDAKEALSVHRW